MNSLSNLIRVFQSAAIVCAIFVWSPVAAQEKAEPPSVVVAEGERFTLKDELGWEVRHQEQSYATQAFGGMWVTHGGLLGAPADSVDSVAIQRVTIPAAGNYRVWSKYQAPPYFSYLHRVEIWQSGRKVFSHDYGKLDAERMWSFCGASTYNLPPKKQIWFPWGVDHDAAEAPRNTVRLAKGAAEIRLVTLKNPELGGDRNVDFVLLTTVHDDTCIGWEKHGQAKSAFIFEAIRATPIYFRFKNTTSKPAKARLFTHFGHFTWHCGPKRGVVPEKPVAPGQWSPWTNINQIVELITDEGLQVTLIDGEAEPNKAQPLGGGNIAVPVQIALDTAGRQMLGEMNLPNGETIHFPMDVVWNREKKLQMSKDAAADLVKLSKSGWRKASPHKPRHIAFYGSFSRSSETWATALKNALGYNTLLPGNFETLPIDGYHQHLRNEPQIRKFAEDLGPRRRKFRVCSFGDEISIGGINVNDPQYVEPFRAWLKARKLTRDDLRVSPEQATLTGNNRLAWYAKQFSAEQRFAHYRRLTDVARQAFGPQVLCGANYSPHHDVMYYGNHLQWIDAFKHRAMSMYWTEDYIFFVPELPQTISFMFARMHCATKYHKQPIHMYVMPHAPGQPADYFRRNSLLSIGAGAKHIDHFWVAPQENYSENYVSWQFPDTFQALFESMHDTAAVEPLLTNSRRRPARVAIVTGKATALNEDAAPINVAADKFLKACHIAGKPVQNICRKDQQLIYLALRQAQYQVDLITEDDIVDGKYLGQYKVVYFAGEWINHRAVPKLEQWVKDGGILYASTGLGHLNQYNEKEASFLKLLGIAAGPPQKNLYHHRPLLELPLADPIDTTHADDLDLDAIAFLQKMRPDSPDVRVLARWRDGSAAIAERSLGRGKIYSVGTAIGASLWRTATKPLPWARGGRVNLYNPIEFDKSTWRVMNLGVDAALLDQEIRCSTRGVESFLLDNNVGTLVTLVNWTNESQLDGLEVSVKMQAAPREVFSVTENKKLDFEYANGKLTFQTDLAAADFVKVLK
jgi:hypothetical protein